MKIRSLLPVLITIATYGTCFAQTDQALIKTAQQKKAAFIQDLGTLVNIDSGSNDAKGLERVETILAERLKKLGADVKVMAAPPAAGKMVIGTLHGKGAKNIMLMIHYDTVFGVGEAQKRPFKISGDQAFGPGVADAKGGALIILYALEVARERGFKDYQTLTVLFNPDEELGSPGSRATIKKMAAQQDYVLVFEPPEGDDVTVATNGNGVIYLDVTGKASHAGAAPEVGRNAALELAYQVMQLKDLGDATKGTTVNWTVLQTGDRVNIIPEKARASADIRVTDLAEFQRVQEEADNIIQNKLIPDTEVKFTIDKHRPPFSKNQHSTNLAATANRIYQEIDKSIKPVFMRYSTVPTRETLISLGLTNQSY